MNAAVFHFKEEKKIVAGIYFPKNYPPGAGLVIDQQLFKGANHLSGEIKHLPHLYTASTLGNRGDPRTSDCHSSSDRGSDGPASSHFVFAL